MKKYILPCLMVLSMLVSGCSSTASSDGASSKTEAAQDSTGTAQDANQGGEAKEEAKQDEKGTRKNPAKLNEAVSYKLDDMFYGKANLEITLTNVMRGSDALNYIKNANQFNSDPAAGKEYAVLKFKFTNKENLNSSDDPVEINDAQFSLADASFSVTQNISMIALPDADDLSTKLYEGASKEGCVVFEVNPNEPFYAVYKDNVWFAAE